jgi:hypothetical protein
MDDDLAGDDQRGQRRQAHYNEPDNQSDESKPRGIGQQRELVER